MSCTISAGRSIRTEAFRLVSTEAWQIDLKRFQEGDRVKYRLNGNSTKFYDKAYSDYGSVLRGAETTLNQVQDFRVYRPKEGGPEDDLQWRPMRKGIADL